MVHCYAIRFRIADVERFFVIYLIFQIELITLQ